MNLANRAMLVWLPLEPATHCGGGQLAQAQIVEFIDRIRPAKFWRGPVLAWLLTSVGCSDTPHLQNPWTPVEPVGWEHFAGTAEANRWSPLAQIDTTNVSALTAAWTWNSGESQTGDIASPSPWTFQSTPLVFGDTLFTSTPFNRVVALDATSGEAFWDFDPGATQWPLKGVNGGWRHRGIASWVGPHGRRIILASRWWLISIDAATGRPDPAFGDGGRVDLRPGLKWTVDSLMIHQTSAPAIWRDMVVVGSSIGDQRSEGRPPPGSVQAFDLLTGEPQWRWHPIPSRGEEGWDTWGPTDTTALAHANVWGTMTVDDEHGLLFVPVSAAGNDFFGGSRPGDNLFSQSLVALDLRTGTKRWHQQLVRHDLWDYDLSEGPVLTTLPSSNSLGEDSPDVGEVIPAVILATKMGFLFAFERVSGRPIWEISELPVPESDVPREEISSTQPFSRDLQPFAHQGFSSGDVIDFTPEIRELALNLIEGRRMGPIFTPPSLNGTVALPGWIGGAAWGAVSLDPHSRLLLVKASNAASLLKLKPSEPDGELEVDNRILRDSATVRLPEPWWFLDGYRGEWRVPVNRPPWGTLTAFDLDTRAIVWQIPAGRNRWFDRHPDLRKWGSEQLGTLGTPGAIVTGGGLAFLTGGGTDLLAIAVESGDVLGSWALGGIGYSVPATYSASDGYQYVVTGVGSDRLSAFRLGGL